MSDHPIGIGSTIWEYNEYRRGPSGEKGRDNWEPRQITGETSRSWIVGGRWNERKVPKKGFRYGWAFSEQERDERIWASINKYRILRLAERAVNDNPALLRQIAKLIDYKEDSNA